MRKNILRFLPFALLVVLILIVYLTNVHQHLTLENLRKEESRLLDFVQAHPILSPFIFIAVYTISVVLIIPDSTILTLLGGLVFPLPLAIAYSVISETVGATIFFAIFHGAFSKIVFLRERPFIHKMRKKFDKHASTYLIFLRISHVIPYWLTNFSAAYFRVSYKTFIWTTFVGVIPIMYVLAYAGHSLSDVFAIDKKITISDVFTTQLKISLVLMSLLAFVPILYKKFIKKRKWKL